MENYTQHITRTRIAIPRKRADLISRQRLLNALDELLDKKVIIIAAPAGYGKTSLLIDLADDLALPVCWYSLDALDQNISRFLEYFVASIQVKFPEFKTNIINILHSSYQKEVDIDAIVTMLVNDIYDQITEHFIIMLDDYHLVVEDTQINQFLSRFLQNVEENCHIVFASRTLLALPDLPLMVARGLVGGLGFEELAFTTGETRELFFSNHHIVLSDTEAENLCKQTEGWITGLLLTAQTSISRLQAHEKSLRATGVNINDYFELIYNAQPEHIQQFLLYTSLLEDFDFDSFNQTVGKLFPELCKQYKTCADHIFKANLFVQSVGLDGLSLRYHHLFLDYLQQKVRLEQAETYEKLQDIIASHYRQTQQWEKAYEIYKKDGQLEKQITLLEEAGVSMMSSGRFGLLQEWITDFPDSTIVNHASLCSLLGIILGTEGDLNNSLSYLDKAILITNVNDNPGLAARNHTRKATTLRMMGNYSGALSSANDALDIINNDLSLRLIRAEAYRIIGSTYTEMGNTLKSLEFQKKALEDYRFLKSENEIAVTSLNISMVYFMLGELNTTKQYLLETINYWEQTGNHAWLANALNNLGFLQHISGDIESAIMNLEKALHYSRITNYSRIEAVSLSSIGDIYSDLEAFNEAEELYKQSLEIGKKINTKTIIVYAYFSLALNSIYKNDLSQAEKYILEAKQIDNFNESEYDKNLILFTEALKKYYEQDFETAISLFTQAISYFITENNIVFIGREALYILLSTYLLDKKTPLNESYKKLEDYLLQAEKAFSLLPSGLREYKIITKISKEYPSFTTLTKWMKSIEQFKIDLPSFRRRIRRKSTIIPFAPAKLEIISLGNLGVKHNDKWLSSSDWQTQSARDLFFLILSNPQGLSKEEIGLLLWPEDSEQELKFHFKNAIYRVRHAISKDSIILDGDRYYFNKSIDYHFDAADFRREIHLINEIKEWKDKYMHFQNALKIYKGQYLPGINADWIQQERLELHQLFLRMLKDMSSKAFQHEEFLQAIDIAKMSLENDPCDEESYRIAMRAQAANGNRMEVERLYKQCERYLMEELEAPPSQKTQKLHKTLLKI